MFKALTQKIELFNDICLLTEKLSNGQQETQLVFHKLVCLRLGNYKYVCRRISPLTFLSNLRARRDDSFPDNAYLPFCSGALQTQISI